MRGAEVDPFARLFQSGHGDVFTVSTALVLGCIGFGLPRTAGTLIAGSLFHLSLIGVTAPKKTSVKKAAAPLRPVIV